MNKVIDQIKEEIAIRLADAHIRSEFTLAGKRYGCVCIFQEGDEEGDADELKYEVEVRCLKNLPARQRRLFQMERISETWINEYEPDLLVDQLAYVTGQVFYPLVVEVDYSGRFAGIYNHAEINERWPDIRKKADDYFKGEEVIRYLDQVEQTLRDREALNESFAGDLFISTFFAPIYKNYTSAFSVQAEQYHPVMGEINPLRFQVEETLRKELTDYHAIEIRHTGELTDERTVTDLEQGENYPIDRLHHPEKKQTKGTYNAYYTLNPKTRQIRTIDARWELELNTKKTVEVKIHQMDSDVEDPHSLLVEEEPKKKKKGFFSAWLEG